MAFEIPRTIVDDNIKWVGTVNFFGQRIGLWKQYIDNELWSTYEYLDQKNVLCREYCGKPYYYKEGKKMLTYRGTYVWYGEIKLFYPNQSLHTIYHCKISYSHPSSSGAFPYFDGKLTSFYPEGTILRTCELVNNRIVGPYILYNRDGTLSSREDFPSAGSHVDFNSPDFLGDEDVLSITNSIEL